MKVPVDDGPEKVIYAQMDQNGSEKVQKYSCKMCGLAKH